MVNGITVGENLKESGVLHALPLSGALPRELQFLFCIARPILLPAHIEKLVSLADQGLSWDRIIESAGINRIIILLDKQLRALPQIVVPANAKRRLSEDAEHEQRTQFAIHVHELVLVRRLLEKRAARYALLKGSAVTTRLYPLNVPRQSVDVDVLVDTPSLEKCVAALLDQGYRVINKDWDNQTVGALCRFGTVVELLSPAGMVVELHKYLDGTGCVFPQRLIWNNVEPGAISGEKVSMLRLAVQCLYLCYHHSRHKWGSLHWCVDLRAMLTGGQVDLAEVERFAIRLGLQRVLAEALLLNDNLETIADSGAMPTTVNSLFLSDCVRLVSRATGDTTDAEEHEVKQPDFPSRWQEPRAYRQRRFFARIAPGESDFKAIPLPRTLWWSYWLLKPFRYLMYRMIPRG